MTGRSQRHPAQTPIVIDDPSCVRLIDVALAELEVASRQKDIPLSVKAELLAILASKAYARHRPTRTRGRSQGDFGKFVEKGKSGVSQKHTGGADVEGSWIPEPARLNETTPDAEGSPSLPATQTTRLRF